MVLRWTKGANIQAEFTLSSTPSPRLLLMVGSKPVSLVQFSILLGVDELCNAYSVVYHLNVICSGLIPSVGVIKGSGSATIK